MEDYHLTDYEILWDDDPVMGTYPEVLEEGIFDNFFKKDHEEFNDFDEAIKFLDKHKGWQLYTELEVENSDYELDCEDDNYDPEEAYSYYMDRGNHWVNRTGNYAVVYDKRYRAMIMKRYD